MYQSKAEMTSYFILKNGNSNVYFMTIYKIFTIKQNAKAFTFKMKVKVKMAKTERAPFDWKCSILYW